MDLDDRYLWLEEVEGDSALAWVKARNDLTVAKFATAPEFESLKNKFNQILTSKDRILRARKAGEYAYNFWQDESHPRGLWRRTLWTNYVNGTPQWETVIDFDDLSRREGVQWSYRAADFLEPSFDRCLVYLSPGGSDASEIREFDLTTKEFVSDGFRAPRSKGAMEWIDQDRVFVFIDFGKGSLTKSGYARMVKEWQRGTPIESAMTVFSGEVDDLSVSAMVNRSSLEPRQIITRAKSFYAGEYFYRGSDGKLQRIPVPESSDILLFGDVLVISLKDPWAVNGQTFAEGSVLACDFLSLMAGQCDMTELFKADAQSSVQGWGRTRDFVFIHATHDLKNSLYILRQEGSGWSKERNHNIPEIGSLEIWAVDRNRSNEIFVKSADYLAPDSLFLGEIKSSPRCISALPQQFDSSGCRTEQFFASSRDGTKIPYFVVSSDHSEATGDSPTILYGYGGFEVSLLPEYDPLTGAGWIAAGGVYVVANIRGGGEYGPRWHKAALKEKRHKCYEDFAAVAEDLIRRGISSPERLGIEGGSNGGLLVGNMLVRYPNLFGAVVCSVPLLDMKRYHKLLAGSSWMDEYGDPDKDDEWEYIKTFSPYHLLRPGVRYPPTLFTTSTKDDRVHPGHARKMMARMEALGQRVWYYENIEGGHAGSVTPDQKAFKESLVCQFFKEQLVNRFQKSN